MAIKTRYMSYATGMQKNKKKEQVSSAKSILAKLKELKNEEFKITVPIGGMDGE